MADWLSHGSGSKDQPLEYLTWEYRLQLIVQNITAVNPDGISKAALISCTPLSKCNHETRIIFRVYILKIKRSKKQFFDIDFMNTFFNQILPKFDFPSTHKKKYM